MKISEFFEDQWDSFYRWVVSIKHWFKYRLCKKHHYHRVYMDLEPDYYDTDTRILYAAFQCLVEFYEKEWDMVYGDWLIEEILTVKDVGEKNQLQIQFDNGQKIKDLYMWWTTIYPDILEAEAQDPFSMDLNKIENEKLKELIELRKHLWS